MGRLSIAVTRRGVLHGMVGRHRFSTSWRSIRLTAAPESTKAETTVDPWVHCDL